MTTKDYIQKTEDILASFNRKDNNEEVYNDLAREFKHLVYRYDSSLPINEELNSIKHITPVPFEYGETDEIKQYRKYIEFFIKYLKMEGGETWRYTKRILIIILVCVALCGGYLYLLNGRYIRKYHGVIFDKWTESFFITKTKPTGEPYFVKIKSTEE